MPPLVGLNVDINFEKPTEARIARSYYEAVLAVNCIPVLIPPMKRRRLRGLLPKLDGTLFIGGRDYGPDKFNQTVHADQPFNPLHEDRQEFDLMLAEEVLDIEDMAILGICGGEQALNIALDGTLHQHVPAAYPDSQVLHLDRDENGKAKSTRHPVSLVRGTRLAKIFRRLSLPEVVSAHHQSVSRLGRGLILSAFAADGVTEGFELPDREFVIGVQWHPERDLASQLPLFKAFARSARKRARNRSPL